MAAKDDKPKNALVNGDFQAGSTGWKTEGDIRFLPKGSQAAKASVRLGTAASAIRQRYRIGGLQTLWFGANLTPLPADKITGRVRVACFDAKDRLLLEARGELDKASLSGGSAYASVYMKTHAYAQYIVLSVERASGGEGALLVDSALLQDDSLGPKRPPTTCDLDELLIPFWKGATVRDETVLLLSESDEAPHGKLLFPPTRILSVRDYGLKKTYLEGRDFALTGNALTALPNSSIPTMRASDFERGDLKWFKLAGKHVSVTYGHGSAWRGPTPGFEGDGLPHTLRKLRDRKPLTIVAFGDSITHGTGTSGDTRIPPFLPTWAELFVHGLKREFRHEGIRLYNAALGGMTSDWGRDNASAAVGSLQPDLALIAFGMNDFWSLPPERFLANIRAMIRGIRAARPTAEFILIASMRFDPEYAKAPEYRARMAGYASGLRGLVGAGVGLLDMDAICGALLTVKKSKDLISDPLHPNDFLARWYAQGLVAAFTKPGVP